jgi:hypothetical protein
MRADLTGLTYIYAQPSYKGRKLNSPLLLLWVKLTKMLYVGTLKLGYPLLLYKVAVPTRLSLSRVVKVLCVGPAMARPSHERLL